MDGARVWQLGSRPQLDVVRALAVLLVVAEHAGVPGFRSAGGVGVTMFFTLSGFLITVLLLEENSREGRVSLRRFYLRRAYRLFPALLLFLASMAVMALAGDQVTLPRTRDFLGALFYVGNYTSAMQGRDTTLLHTWSLAVEEQFYLVWPCLVVVALARVRHHRVALMGIALAASAIAVVLRISLWDDGRGVLRVYFGSDTRMDCLLIGCLAALWLHGRDVGVTRTRLATSCVVAAAGCSVLDGASAIVVAPSVVALLTAAAVLLMVQGGVGGWLAARPLVVLGQRSYGIYLWHFPLVATAASLPTPLTVPAVVVALLLTAAMAELSWRCVEEPFLKRRYREASGPARRATRLSV